MAFRQGVRVAVDVGKVRIGVAASDPAGLLASPVETVPAGRSAFERLAEIVVEREALEVIVGLPRMLSGDEGVAAVETRTFAQRLARRVAPCPVRLVDERMTTASAAKAMRASGTSARQGRNSVDQAAAMVILQDALDWERSAGAAPGELVRVD
ncbi:MAG TPA: Holliday junction resolvase RuvX [Jiangellaceae bacterium]